MTVLRDPDSQTGMKVTSDGEGEVRAIVEQEIEHVSQIEGRAYIWTSLPYSSAAGDTILAVTNTSTSRILHPTHMHINNGATATAYQIHLITAAYTSAGTEVVGVKMNTASPHDAEAEGYADETGNSQGTIISTVYMPVDSCRIVDFRGIDLGQGTAIAIDVVENAISEVSVSLFGHYGEIV